MVLEQIIKKRVAAERKLRGWEEEGNGERAASGEFVHLSSSVQ